MSLTAVHSAIVRHLRDVTVTPLGTEETIGGENVRVAGTPATMSLAVFPLSDRELKFLPEGVYRKQDVKLYEIGGPSIDLKSTVVVPDGDTYLVNDYADRNFEGGFTKYLCKRIDRP
jgi:hypothetical protein